MLPPFCPLDLPVVSLEGDLQHPVAECVAIQ